MVRYLIGLHSWHVCCLIYRVKAWITKFTSDEVRSIRCGLVIIFQLFFFFVAVHCGGPSAFKIKTTSSEPPDTNGEIAADPNTQANQSGSSTANQNGSSTGYVADNATDLTLTKLGEACQKDMGFYVQGANEGVDDTIVVCPGKDWWLPESVERSKHGIVFTGYGLSTQGYPDSTTDGQAISVDWNEIEREDDGSSILNWWKIFYKADDDLSCKTHVKDYTKAGGEGWFHKSLLTALCNIGAGGTKREIMLPLRGGLAGTGNPKYLNTTYGLPFLSDVINATTYPILETETVSTGESVLDYFKDYWDDFSKYAYPFWYGTSGQYSKFFTLRKAFHKRLATFLANHPYGSLVSKLNLNAEFGDLSLYVRYGLFSSDIDKTMTLVDKLEEKYVDSAVGTGIDASKWLINICMGGRIYNEFAELAAEKGTGIGNHGVPAIFRYQFAQHLKHITYDQGIKAYRNSGDMPYAFFHVDNENLDKTSNTLGQLTIFEFMTQAGFAMGVNSILVSNYTIPSRGEYCAQNDCSSDERKQNFDWSQIQKYGAAEFLEWMNKIIGQPASETPEAYCQLAQTGYAMPDGVDFEAEVAKLKSDKYWSLFDDSGEMQSWPNYLNTPELTHFGFYCFMDATTNEGTPALLLDNERTGGAIDPAYNSGAFGDGVYEGRTTVDPNDVSLSSDDVQLALAIGHPEMCLHFNLDDAFTAQDAASPETFIVKVFYENYQSSSGSWRLEYDGSSGWTTTTDVNFDESESGVYTATYRLKDAAFSGGGANSNDLAICSVSGDAAAFLNLRVIKE